MDSLVDHVLVVGHLQPQIVGHEMEKMTLRDVLHRSGVDSSDVPRADLERVVPTAGRAIVIQGAAHHVGHGRFVEVPHACGCGGSLHGLPGQVPRAWALHTAVATGLDADLLQRHPVLHITGERATVTCACGRQFYASDNDPTDPGYPLREWEEHVRETGR